MNRSSRRRAAPRDILVFWITVACLAVALGAAGFAVGKYLIGGMVGGSEVDTGAPEIVVQSPDDHPTGTAAPIGPPPAEAVVKVTERAPSEAERIELETQLPQDAAQLSADTGDVNPPDTSLGPDDKPLPPAQASEGEEKVASKSDETGGKRGATQKGAYSVVAGSFADPTNAEREVSRLTAQGYKPYVVKVKREGKTFHRVLVGSFADQREATRLRDRLIGEGTPASLARD
ncbi:MAG: SPOR domain-containing protein [Armatimonadetes bacterium]|nr:SPOR domain-containing protein [Armatimonadota bacterium]